MGDCLRKPPQPQGWGWGRGWPKIQMPSWLHQIQEAGSRPENLHSNTLICMTEIPWQGAKDTPLRHPV